MKTKERFRKLNMPDFTNNFMMIGDDECWNWTGKTSEGYGIVRENHLFDVQRSNWHIGAHVASWCLANDTIPAFLPMDPTRPGRMMSVMHLCANRRCVNPHHLRLGTHRENMHDRDVDLASKKRRAA